MRLWIPFPGGGISHAAVDSLSWGEHFACGCGFPFQEGHFACGCGFPFQGEHFACGFSLPGGAFRMRQVRGGEAFIVAKAIVPSSRSSPPATGNGLLPALRAKRLLRTGCVAYFFFYGQAAASSRFRRAFAEGEQPVRQSSAIDV